MFCSTNFKTKKNIDVCFQKMLSCLSNARQRKVNSLKFAYVPNSNAQEYGMSTRKKFRENCLRMASL